MCRVMAIASRTKKARKAQCSATKTAQFRRVIQIRETEMIFTLNGMALWMVKFLI